MLFCEGLLSGREEKLPYFINNGTFGFTWGLRGNVSFINQMIQMGLVSRFKIRWNHLVEITDASTSQ